MLKEDKMKEEEAEEIKKKNERANLDDVTDSDEELMQEDITKSEQKIDIKGKFALNLGTLAVNKIDEKESEEIKKMNANT